MYFVSFGVVEWVDVFTRKDYRDIVIESLQHRKKEKGLVIYGWSRLRRDE
jgi:putative transposase